MMHAKGKMKSLGIIITAILMVFSIAACSSGGGKDNGQQTQQAQQPQQSQQAQSSTDSGKKDQKEIKLVVYGEWEPGSPRYKFWDEIFRKYEEKNPGIKIELKAIASQQFNQAFTAAVTANQQIDIVEVNVQFFRNYVTKGLLEDITDKWKHNDWRHNIVWDQVKYFAMSNKIYGIPMVLNSTGIYYNKEVFKKYNLETPKTWKDMEKIAEILKPAGIAPLTYAGAEPWWNPMHFNMIFYQITKNKGIETNDKFMQGDFSPEILANYEKTMQFFYDLQSKGIMDKESQGLKLDQAQKKLEDGKAAMYFMGDWFASGLIQNKQTMDKIGLTKVPVMEEGLKPQNPGSINTIFSIYSKSKNKEEAMKLLEFVASKEVSDSYQKSGTATGEPIFPDVEAATDYSKWFTKNAQSDTVIWLDAIWEQPIIEEFQQGVGKVMSGKITPKEEVEAIVNKYKQLRTEGKTYNK